MKKKLQKAALKGSIEAAVKRREVESKGEKERYSHLNADFQRTAKRDKKAFRGDRCREIRKTIEWKRL